MNRNPKATLWLFAYTGLTVATHMSILGELTTWGPNIAHRVKGGDANIDRARSKVASAFLRETYESAGDALLMVDSDNAWQPGDLAKIAKRALEHNAVVGGIYPKRAFNQGPALRVAVGAEGTYKIGQDHLLPAEFVGTGFIAIPRLVLEAVGRTLPTLKGDFKPFFMPYAVNGEYPTDDWAFCARVREAGFKVFASTYPRLTHEGSYTYRMVDSDKTPPPDRDMEFTLMTPKELQALSTPV